MRRIWVTLGVIIGVPILLVTLMIIDSSIYPFTAKNPNYKDVESAFSRLQFPSDWQEIDSSENKGIAGRDCDKFNTSGCFHKSKTFKVPESTTVNDMKAFFESTGCKNVMQTDQTNDGELAQSFSLRCSLSKVTLAGSFRGPENEAYIVTRTY